MNSKINEEKIFEKLKEFKTDVKESSLNIYFKNIKKIIKDLEFTRIREFLQNEKIINYLEQYKHLVRRNYLNSLIIFLQSYKFKDNYIKIFQDLRDEYNEEYNKNMEEGNKSKNEEENWISLEEINKYLDNIRPTLSKTKDPKKFMDYMIMKLQISYPMRNELHCIKLINEKNYNLEDKSDNYIVFKKIGSFFSLSNYKTNKKYGVRKFDLEKEDNDLIRIWKNKFHNKENNNLIYNLDNGKDFNTNTYSKYLINLFEKGFNRRIGSRLIRKIVMSELFLENKNLIKKMSNIAGNSPSTINNIYVKN
jgi:hypothetical protein